MIDNNILEVKNWKLPNSLRILKLKNNRIIKVENWKLPDSL